MRNDSVEGSTGMFCWASSSYQRELATLSLELAIIISKCLLLTYIIPWKRQLDPHRPLLFNPGRSI